MPEQVSPVIFLMGPTASGKTDLAVRLLDTFPLELVSVDSALVYRGMDIGTAKPDAELLRRAPHRLIDIRDPGEPYSAAAFCADARREIADIHAAGRIPLLVGGTMLYFRALRDGLAELPAADPATRTEVEQLAQEQGWQAVHARLAEVDGEAAARLKPSDRQRVARALEVYLVSGKPISELWATTGQLPLAGSLLQIALVPEDRSLLHARIELRLQQMFDAGFMDEVRFLFHRGDLRADLPSMRAVGYRQAWSSLAGELPEAELFERALFATRQLAKRQLTWLRGWPEAVELDPFSGSLPGDACQHIQRFLSPVSSPREQHC